VVRKNLITSFYDDSDAVIAPHSRDYSEEQSIPPRHKRPRGVAHRLEGHSRIGGLYNLGCPGGERTERTRTMAQTQL